jgi:hypothetical protein
MEANSSSSRAGTSRKEKSAGSCSRRSEACRYALWEEHFRRGSAQYKLGDNRGPVFEAA